MHPDAALIDRNFRATHTLADGGCVRLRLLVPEDRDELRTAYARLSHASRYLRFHASGPKLTDDVLDQLMDTDDRDRLAIVATEDSLDLKTERGIGIARFVRLRDEPDVAEAAVTVADGAQGRGIGRLLLTTLAAAARERGIRAFRANVLAANEPMCHLLAEAGAVLRDDDGDARVFDVPLDPSPAGPKHGSPFRVLRAVAKYMGRRS